MRNDQLAISNLGEAGNGGPKETGYFVFSLDTELAIGYFDWDKKRAERFSPDGSRERWSIRSILGLLDEFNLVATWAVVGHLFYERCEFCKVCPIKEWQGKYKSFEEVYGTGNPLWYGADVFQWILNSRLNHEIGFHGYTHELFSEKVMSRERATLEIEEWMRLAGRHGITPKSVVFPRDKSGHLDVMAEHGLVCYRSEQFVPLVIRNKYFGKYAKVMDHILSISTPPVYNPDEFENNGIVRLLASQHFFDFNRKAELILDGLNLHYLRIKRMLRAVQKAAEEKKVVHIWAHPWEFRTQKDIEKLRLLFECVSEEIEKGRMQSIRMIDLAEMVRTRPARLVGED